MQTAELFVQVAGGQGLVPGILPFPVTLSTGTAIGEILFQVLGGDPGNGGPEPLLREVGHVADGLLQALHVTPGVPCGPVAGDEAPASVAKTEVGIRTESYGRTEVRNLFDGHKWVAPGSKKPSNLYLKTLFGGPKGAVLRTFRWEVSLSG